MKAFTKFLFSLCCATQLYSASNTGFNSEASHFIGGAVMAGSITAIVDKYYPEYADKRQIIGIALSSGIIVLEQSYEAIQHGDARSQMIDALAHIGGAVVGAYITDKYILEPIIKSDPNGHRTVGVQFSHSF